MKSVIFLFFSFTLFVCNAQNKEKKLFQIVVHNKIGYINKEGAIIIKPQFSNAGNFSEGYAEVRMNGTYGYIDEAGKYVISPQYDYATPFHYGLAVVYKDGLPLAINSRGEQAFTTNYATIGPFENGMAMVVSNSKKVGLINTVGKLIIDTQYTRIGKFYHGFAVVSTKKKYITSSNEEKEETVVGIIDTLGKQLVPLGKYVEISDYEEGYFEASIPAEPWDTIDGYSKRTGFLDTTGKYIMSKDHSNSSWIDGDMHCGLAKINLYKNWVLEQEGISYSSENVYEGFINLKGEVVINDTNYKWVKDFASNRAFVVDDDRNNFMIDTRGKIITKDTFTDLAGNGFYGDVAFVAKNRKYGMIDTNGTFLIAPQFEGIYDDGLIDGYFFFYVVLDHEEKGYDRLYGVAKKDGSIVLQPSLFDFNRNGFEGGLLSCIMQHKLTYINTEGKIIWQATEDKDNPITYLNLDIMNRGYFYAHSLEQKKTLEGHGRSGNIPRKIKKKDGFDANCLRVVVRPDLKDTLYQSYHGITVYVANTTHKNIAFNCQDSRLYMKVQALTTKGEWKDIEYLPSSWCGNSYYILQLTKNHFWKFVTPVYDGDFKTKLRIELKYLDPSIPLNSESENNELTIYSNEFEGSVNPGQFWNKREYHPNGIMDPYND